MSVILIDTHVWIWYVAGSEELAPSIQKKITEALHEQRAHISAISLWEIGMLENKQRVVFEMPCLEWINQSIARTRIGVAPITSTIAVDSCNLPGEFHGDPADRIIVATARSENMILFTRDVRILAYSKHRFLSTVKA